MYGGVSELITGRQAALLLDTDTDLVYEGLVQEVWASNAEVQDIYLLEDGIVEGVQEPRRVRHLQQRTHPQNNKHPHVG